MTCAVCGRSLTDDARFCSGCGTPVSSSLSTDERKVVTVLFADLVDSTGLAQRIDAERAREVLRRFFDAATEELLDLRGRAEKFIGDAVMAVFGLQQVHEDDALRAVRAGLAIRDRARRLSEALRLGDALEVRVGIETGEAATGIGPAGQLLVTGSVVNAAARLQTAAEPERGPRGLNRLRRSRVGRRIRRCAASSGKGFDAPLEAYPVEGLTTRSVRRTIPIVGRADELRRLRGRSSGWSPRGEPALFTSPASPGRQVAVSPTSSVAGWTGRQVLTAGGVPRRSATFAPVATIVRDLAGSTTTTRPTMTPSASAPSSTAAARPTRPNGSRPAWRSRSASPSPAPTSRRSCRTSETALLALVAGPRSHVARDPA